MRRIYGLIGLVLLFTNCVTLFHSARVLEPNQFEMGTSLGYSELFAYVNPNASRYFYGFDLNPNASKIITFYSRVGIGKGFNLGASFGLPYTDISLTKEILKEKGANPSLSITGDAYLYLGIPYAEDGYFLSLNAFKSNYRDYFNFNPSLRLRIGAVNWSSFSFSEGDSYHGKKYKAGILYGNEFITKKNLRLMPYISFEFSYGEFTWVDVSHNGSIDFGLSVFYRS